MNHRVIALMTVLMLAVTGVTTVGIASAQSAGNQTSTATDAPNTDSSNNESAVTKISDTVTLMSYRFDGDTVTLNIKSDYAQPIVLSDMFVSGTGASKIPQKRMMLSTGSNSISFETTAWKGTQGVVVGTTNGAIAVSQETGGWAFSSEYSAQTLVVIFAFAMLTGVGLVLAIAYKREISYTSNVVREV